MNKVLHRIVSAVVTLMMTVVSVESREATAAVTGRSHRHAFGGSFSLNGSGIVYRHDLRGDVFYEVALEVDYSHSVMVSRTLPGVWARYGYNVVFAEKTYSDGTLRCYAGPGVALGYITDTFNSQRGLAGGLTGTVGLEYAFKVPVILSVSITPCLGFHYCRKDGAGHLDFYRGGITYSFLPNIGIKYSF